MFDEAHVIYRCKYLPFTAGSLKTISEGTIKFTCPLEFNDPFDGLPYYDTTNLERIPKIRRDLFRAAGTRRGLTPAERVQKKGEFVARLRKRINDGSWAEGQLKRVGVVSLSRNALSILMWSHYAEYHHGFVLEFRIPILGGRSELVYATDRLLPFPVKYQPNRPVVMVSQFDKGELFHEILLTKSDLWKYEEEERVISEQRPAGIFPYRRDDILCSVIAGMRMSERNEGILAAVCEKVRESTIPNLCLYKAEPHGEQYTLHVPSHPRLEILLGQ